MKKPRQGESDWLFRYLEDHLLGATGGVRLFEAAAQTWKGTQHGRTLTRLQDEIAGERAELLSSLKAQGHHPNPAKMAFAHLGAITARVNPLNARIAPKPGDRILVHVSRATMELK